MKGVFSAPGDYVYFKSQVPLHKIPIGSKQWRYYDFGPKVVPPLICLPGTAGTADVYYKQIMALSMKGYRVISVDIPRVWNHQEWIQAFEKFLDAIDVHHIHLYGTSLGGFLAQLFAQHRPRRVKSLVLSNTFLETNSFAAAMPWAPFVGWTPSFLLKRYVLTGIRDGPHEPFIADSVDFVVAQVETLSRDDLASRLSLTVDAASVGPLLLSDSLITIMDTNDFCAIPQQLKDQVTERYPGARQAYLKSGGDFPFLSRPDEVNLHLQPGKTWSLAYQRMMLVGVQATRMMNKEELTMHKMIEPAMEAPEMEANHLVPDGPDSGNSQNQHLSNAYLSNIIGEHLVPLMLLAVMENEQAIIASKAVLHFICEYVILDLLRTYLSSLYITLEV
ncbi:UNVERIFIED_CONTAM: Maspardin [Sesamum angustifolium]|uniref:Maspardin n=1 Tax=Sesamum angustifolium TaxID=2727405 RepID=A0AAW2MLL4_9LAMI